MRKLLERDVFIHLTESGFVETTRYFGLPKRRLSYNTLETESSTDIASDERLMQARLRDGRDRGDGNRERR
jgi:hypothetical protein